MRLAIKSGGKTDALKACIYFTDGRVVQFKNQSFALPKGTSAAFRGKGDTRPVCPWDCVDCLPGREP